MRERTFVGRREAGWRRLETLVERVGRHGIRRLDADEVRELALLYRATTSDLAAAQSRAYQPSLVAYLNRLTARAYTVVYAGNARAGWSNVREFYRETFPREFRRSFATIAAMAALLVGTSLFSYDVVRRQPAAIYAIMPAEEIPDVSQRLHDSNFGFDRRTSAAVSSFIITNNIRVAALAFCGGVTVGILTLYLMVTTGFMIGGSGALYETRGFGSDFWATIAPHGVLELSAVTIAAAAGILLAQAIVAPGRLRRIDALRENGRRAATLMLGVASMLVLAGTIEGFVTPQRISETVRFLIGASTGVGLTAYFLLAGRRSRPD